MQLNKTYIHVNIHKYMRMCMKNCFVRCRNAKKVQMMKNAQKKVSTFRMDGDGDI